MCSFPKNNSEFHIHLFQRPLLRKSSPKFFLNVDIYIQCSLWGRKRMPYLRSRSSISPYLCNLLQVTKPIFGLSLNLEYKLFTRSCQAIISFLKISPVTVMNYFRMLVSFSPTFHILWLILIKFSVEDIHILPLSSVMKISAVKTALSHSIN